MEVLKDKFISKQQQEDKQAKKSTKRKISLCESQKVFRKKKKETQHLNKILKNGHSRDEEGLEGLGLEKGQGRKLRDTASLADSPRWSH